MTSSASQQTALSDATSLFKRLNKELSENTKETYFNDLREFKSLEEVVDVIGEFDSMSLKGGGSALLANLRTNNQLYKDLLQQQIMIDSIIEEVVTFQHGGLNNSVETMQEVVRDYTKGLNGITVLRSLLLETKSVLTAKKSGQIAMRDLWLKKKELEETLRILNDLEWLKDSPVRVNRLVQQKRYFSAVVRLNKALETMFSEDFTEVTSLGSTRDQLLELKGKILENVVSELTDSVVGKNSIHPWVSGIEDTSESATVLDEGSTTVSETRFVNAIMSIYK